MKTSIPSTARLKAPFPWFGGKSVIAADIWRRFGNVQNYVEPFFGSGAVLLNRHDWTPGATETVNDADGMLCNFWRAVQADPDAVAAHADWPVNECDLHARHLWLVGQREDITARLMGDSGWYDAQAAGWWVWGICAWIGHGWCSGEGPWKSVDGVLVRDDSRGMGIKRQRPHLGTRGQGINRQLPHLGNRGEWIKQWFADLQYRLHDVRICCGDWSRVCGPTPTVKLGTTAVLLDPPYSVEDRSDCYSVESYTVAADVRAWAIEHGNYPRLRIALCGYQEEHAMPDDWVCMAWKTSGGYGSQGNAQGRINADRECVWFSPHCVKINQTVRVNLSLFEGLNA